MFQSARLKLTAWYLTLIMAISIFFSVVIYHNITLEVARSLRMQQFRIYKVQHPGATPPTFVISPNEQSLGDPEIFENAVERIRLILILVNAGILLVSGGAAYFLAGRTLRPIKEMVDEQNRFITDASHELRTPLTALRSEIEVNLRDEKLTIEDAKKLLASNLEEVDNLQALSDNLLLLAQNKKPNDISVSQPVAISEIIKKAMHKVQSLAKKKDITLHRKNLGKYTVIGDAQHLIQLFVILLENAIKYSPEKTTVTITAESLDHSILIQVTDQGIGIEKKDMPHIFDRFYRADSSRTKQDVSGYGLGLSIAKKIIEAHNGDIRVTSEKNKGTTFTIQLQKSA